MITQRDDNLKEIAMTLTNVVQVQELYRSFEEGDRARVLGCFSEDVERTQPGTTRLSGVHRGRDAVAEFLVDIARYGLSVRPIELFGQGTRVVAVVAVEHIGDTDMLSSVVTGGAAS
jgi:ketosteroid isomerase-like protein